MGDDAKGQYEYNGWWEGILPAGLFVDCAIPTYKSTHGLSTSHKTPR